MSRNDDGVLLRWHRGIIDRHLQIAEEELEFHMHQAAESAKEKIRTRSTGSEWRAAQNRPYPGRYETGAMEHAVVSRVSRGPSGQLTGRFGWLQDRDEYYLYQEGGFDHVRAGRRVEGMYAIADTADEIFPDLYRSIGRKSSAYRPSRLHVTIDLGE